MKQVRLAGKALSVLEAIPRDGWATAGEIAARLGVTAMSVAMIIRYRLLGPFVTRRLRPSRKLKWEYRRL